MSYLNDAVPADSEAVTLGASRIRELEADLNPLIAQIFTDTGVFLPGWIVAAADAPGGVSLFAPGAIQSADIGAEQVQTGNIATSAITSTQLAAGAVTPVSLASGFVSPAGSVATSSLQGQAVGTAQIALNAITAALLAPGLIKGAVIGQITGSNTAAASVNTLAFAPTVLILTGGTGFYGIGISFLAEVSSGSSPIHVSWLNTAVAAPFSSGAGNGVQWGTNGFTIVPFNFFFNTTGKTVTYIALAI